MGILFPVCTKGQRVLGNEYELQNDQNKTSTLDVLSDSVKLQVSIEFHDFRETYTLSPSKELGRGRYGVVRKVTHTKTKKLYAMKSIEKNKVVKLGSLRKEIDILRGLEHPNIMQLHEIIEDSTSLHIITELCQGGELFDRIQRQTKKKDGYGCFPESYAAFLINQVLSGVSYIHDKLIIHRDLKPENFLFTTPSEYSRIKIIDFGLATYDPGKAGFLTERVGTPYYCAPEVLNKRYTRSCDLWSIGIITYILLCGYPPFVGKDTKEQFNAVQNAQLSFSDDVWKNISEEAKTFISLLLNRDASKRPTATEASKHPWVAKRSDQNEPESEIIVQEGSRCLLS